MAARIWFAASSFAVAVVLVLAAVIDYNAEWRRHQERYKERALAHEKVFSTRDLIAGMTINVQQYYLEGVNRIDRCVTCHLGLQNPKMADEPQPLTSHPGTLLDSHPPQTFGCTMCHGGQGLATTNAAAHGRVPNWHRPLRQGLQIEASCGMCHDDKRLPGAEHLNAGRALFAVLGCVGCHRVAGRGLDIGPDLSMLASKDFTGDERIDSSDWQWNIEHLLDPRSKTPTSIMPNFGLSRDQATALVVYLYSLTGTVVPSAYRPVRRPEIVAATRLQAGRRVFVEYGCGGCHGKNGEGGLANPNSASGGRVPALAKVKEGYWREALIKKIGEGVRTEKADPAGPTPPLNMPAWRGHISPESLDLLADYLFSLAPASSGDDWDE